MNVATVLGYFESNTRVRWTSYDLHACISSVQIMFTYVLVSIKTWAVVSVRTMQVQSAEPRQVGYC